MELQQDKQNSLELSPQIVTMMTTEHYTLQSAQAMEISDINGRTSLFIGAVSSTLIALAFIGQISHLGTAFFALSLLVCTSAGVVTFLVSVVILQRYHWKRFKHTEQIPVLFPSEERR